MTPVCIYTVRISTPGLIDFSRAAPMQNLKFNADARTNSTSSEPKIARNIWNPSDNKYWFDTFLSQACSPRFFFFLNSEAVLKETFNFAQNSQSRDPSTVNLFRPILLSLRPRFLTCASWPLKDPLSSIFLLDCWCCYL